MITNHINIHPFSILSCLQVNEVKLSVVSRKYGANKGMLQSLQQAASTFAGMVTRFCSRLGWLNLELLIGQYQDRFQFGIQVCIDANTFYFRYSIKSLLTISCNI